MTAFQLIQTKTSLLMTSLGTYIRGVAKEGEKPPLTVTSWFWVAAAVAGLVMSVTGTHLILQGNTWIFDALLPITFFLGQAGAWTMYMITHHAIHGAISKKQHLNRLVAEMGSVVVLTLNYDRYWKAHGTHHQPKKLATMDDPDFRWIARWGFYTGRTVEQYWKQLWMTLFNPYYYLLFFYKRLQANFVTAPTYRRWMAIIWWTIVFAVTVYADAWATLAIGYLLPLVFGYGISALFQTLTEHRFGFEGDPRYKTFPRLLSVTPPKSRHIWPWVKYAAKVSFYFYWKVAVLSLDLQQHQLHHAKPRNYDWPMVAYSEAALKDRERAVWGIRAQFNEVFKTLAQAK